MWVGAPAVFRLNTDRLVDQAVNNTQVASLADIERLRDFYEDSNKRCQVLLTLAARFKGKSEEKAAIYQMAVREAEKEATDSCHESKQRLEKCINLYRNSMSKSILNKHGLRHARDIQVRSVADLIMHLLRESVDGETVEACRELAALNKVDFDDLCWRFVEQSLDEQDVVSGGRQHGQDHDGQVDVTRLLPVLRALPPLDVVNRLQGRARRAESHKDDTRSRMMCVTCLLALCDDHLADTVTTTKDALLHSLTTFTFLRRLRVAGVVCSEAAFTRTSKSGVVRSLLRDRQGEAAGPSPGPSPGQVQLAVDLVLQYCPEDVQLLTDGLTSLSTSLTTSRNTSLPAADVTLNILRTLSRAEDRDRWSDADFRRAWMSTCLEIVRGGTGQVSDLQHVRGAVDLVVTCPWTSWDDLKTLCDVLTDLNLPDLADLCSIVSDEPHGDERPCNGIL